MTDMKVELFINLKERISDMIKEGYTEEDAFKKGVISIGDLSDLVEEMQLYGRDKMNQSIDSKEAQHISTKGMIGGILLFLFGVPPHIHQLKVYFYTKCGLSI
ncbi:TPA: hypothetical protein QCY30_004537 [Bacillus toyonensis]|nr:hypothetical protein [Bacillus toyonensis]